MCLASWAASLTSHSDQSWQVKNGKRLRGPVSCGALK